jgi:hypothetical protein
MKLLQGNDNLVPDFHRESKVKWDSTQTVIGYFYVSRFSSLGPAPTYGISSISVATIDFGLSTWVETPHLFFMNTNALNQADYNPMFTKAFDITFS